MYIRVTNDHFLKGQRQLREDPITLALVEATLLPKHCIEVFPKFVFIYDYHKNLRYVCFLPENAFEFYISYMTAYRTPKFISFGFIIGEEEYLGDVLSKVVRQINEID